MTESSVLGWSGGRHWWREVELWRVPAEQILSSGDVGQLPRLPLTRSDLPADALVQLARDRIDADALRREQPTLLTLTAITAGMRFARSEDWIRLLGGKKVLTDSPVYQLWMDENTRETKQQDILTVLRVRFKGLPEELAAEVRATTDLGKLERGIELAARCVSLKSFRTSFRRM